MNEEKFSRIENQNKIIIYNTGELELKVSVENETVWLNRHQMSELFDRDVKTIGKHVNNIFKEKELDKITVIAKFATTAKDGKVYDTQYYNLDMIISVGYRVKSQKGVNFRQWATSVLKQYISDGYAINSEKITHERFKELENDIHYLKQKVAKLDNVIISNQLELKQDIFCDGQVFDAYVFVNDLFRSAENEIVLIDNYIDESVLTIFSKYENINFTIVTRTIPKQLKLDIEKYDKQYKNLNIKTLNKFHDRFIVIDNKIAYHIGASFKDLGKKVFAFSKIDITLLRELIK